MIVGEMGFWRDIANSHNFGNSDVAGNHMPRAAHATSIHRCRVFLCHTDARLLFNIKIVNLAKLEMLNSGHACSIF